MTDWLLAPASERAMDRERAALKAQLFSERRQMRVWRGKLVYLCQCDLCGQPFGPGLTMPDLHEVLLDRGDVQSANNVTQHAALHTSLNLQLLCNDPCNIRLADDDLLKTHLIGIQVERYGLNILHSWLRVTNLILINNFLARVTQAAIVSHAAQSARSQSQTDIRLRAEFLEQVRVRLREYGRQPLF